MKRITVGRGIDCDIVIPDETDNVSRHHFVISFYFFGKMTLSDTSSNGTFINDNRMLKGASIPVTRKDRIRLGEAWNFDWTMVKDPYANIRKSVIGALIAIVVILLGWLAWSIYDNRDNRIIVKQDVEFPDAKEENDTWTKDSTDKYAPVERSIKTDKAQKKSKVGRKKHSSRSVYDHKYGSKQKESSKNSSDSVTEMPLIN